MKMIRTALAAFCMASPAFAGGMAEPVVEPEVIVEDTAGTSGGIIVPLLLLVLIAVAVSHSDGDAARQT
ncbi:hypothetical protein [Ostreiculturibacter nitratireducens]|uniref:hypothetical protein n=1 Tax=Ostreiculturibacter nitratireducens TaxID=3075226 RepID=UPI0031B5C4B1